MRLLSPFHHLPTPSTLSPWKRAMIEIDTLMSGMAHRRPIFCSEADFQHELAMEIRRLDPGCKIRLEYPLGEALRGAADILLQGEQPFALELEYLCKGLTVVHEWERFTLRQQSAHDIRRHDVCKDVAWMEAFSRRLGSDAAVLVLTNDPAYWLPRSAWTPLTLRSTSRKQRSW